jgi:hypothetical protein
MNTVRKDEDIATDEHGMTRMKKKRNEESSMMETRGGNRHP